MRYIYLHGFASGPSSRKARFFADRFQALGIELETPELTPPENEGGFQSLTLTKQLALISDLLAGTPCVMMGSSMGGYLSALYASRHPETARIVLLAPAFCLARRWQEAWGTDEIERWRATGYREVFHYAQNRQTRIGYTLLEDAGRYEDYPAVTQRALVFHGRLDPIVPVEYAREFTARTPGAQLVEFDSGHELTDCLEPMWDATSRFLFPE
jgi:pimeloyl-ACP methyl ester carboxylesterase